MHTSLNHREVFLPSFRPGRGRVKKEVRAARRPLNFSARLDLAFDCRRSLCKLRHSQLDSNSVNTFSCTNSPTPRPRWNRCWRATQARAKTKILSRRRGGLPGLSRSTGGSRARRMRCMSWCRGNQALAGRHAGGGSAARARGGAAGSDEREEAIALRSETLLDGSAWCTRVCCSVTKC